MIAKVAENEVKIFGRLIESGSEPLSLQAGRYIRGLGFPPDERERMHERAVKARDGALIAAEQVEIDAYERVGTLLSMWKSKARTAFRQVRRSSR